MSQRRLEWGRSLRSRPHALCSSDWNSAHWISGCLLLGAKLGAILYGLPRTAADVGGLESPIVPTRMDPRGHPRTRLGHLRIRRLGVRGAPGALSKSLAVAEDSTCPRARQKVLAGRPLGAIRSIGPRRFGRSPLRLTRTICAVMCGFLLDRNYFFGDVMGPKDEYWSHR